MRGADGHGVDAGGTKRRGPLKALTWLDPYSGHVLVETVGCRRGSRRRTVVGGRWEGGVLRIVAEHGRRAGYVANLLAQRRVRAGGRWYRGSTSLEERVDPDKLLDSWRDPAHAGAVGAFGTDLAVVRVDDEHDGDDRDRRRSRLPRRRGGDARTRC